MAAALQRRAGSQGFLEVYASPGLAVTRIIGPVSDCSKGLAAATLAARRPPGGGGARSGAAHAKAVALAGVERGVSVAFHLDVARELPAEPAYIQARSPAASGAAAGCCLTDVVQSLAMPDEEKLLLTGMLNHSDAADQKSW